ncbi:hypothetical protein EFS06_05545 [Levilactobacillus brevis]|nr:hypothetical protein [Levilactobacillus brevis]
MWKRSMQVLVTIQLLVRNMWRLDLLLKRWQYILSILMRKIIYEFTILFRIPMMTFLIQGTSSQRH